MIRLTWRQFRTQAMVGFGLLAAIAVVLVVTGPHLVHLYDTSIATCGVQGDCSTVISAFQKQDHLLQELTLVVLVAPAIIGIFWGAPLVARELESGTFRLAWTQSVSRTRWLAVKLGLVGLSAMAAAGLLSLMVTWWSSPFEKLSTDRFSPGAFGQAGIVPIGYAAFAFVLGVTAGVLFRRTVPAMATTLVGFVAARVAMTYWVRVHLLAPIRALSTLQLPSGGGGAGAPQLASGALKPGDWVLSEQTINGAGHVIGANGGIGPNGNIDFNTTHNGILTFVGVGRCPNKVPTSVGSGRSGIHNVLQGPISKCVATLHIRELVLFQPASRYWTFQWYETVIFLGLALLLAGSSFWWIRHRLA
jgi:hypothetical protein